MLELRDIMTTEVVTVSRETTLREAAEGEPSARYFTELWADAGAEVLSSDEIGPAIVPPVIQCEASQGQSVGNGAGS
jgi:hypothetical protein